MGYLPNTHNKYCSGTWLSWVFEEIFKMTPRVVNDLGLSSAWAGTDPGTLLGTVYTA